MSRIENVGEWDVLVIGGGATGLGIAVDASSRGLKTLLIEQHDFAKGTSGKSTKLVHGGVRYMAQGNFRLVYEALRERAAMKRNAPHLVRLQPFIIPCYTWFAVVKYLAGLKLYDLLAGKNSFGPSRYRQTSEVTARIPGIRRQGLRGGVSYFDGQFDDARFAINLAQSAAEHSATVVNYFRATGLIKKNGMVSGVRAEDLETGKVYSLHSRIVINATGVFVDDILGMDEPGRPAMVRPSQGIHLVFDQKFLSVAEAMMIPRTSDGRVLFAIPWNGRLLAGTTDTPLDTGTLEPVPQEQEIRFVIETLAAYLQVAPKRSDILSIFVGLRPLAAPSKTTGTTKEISRDHKLIVGRSGMITITGGKWTTYRKMAEDAVDRAMRTGKFHFTPCRTKNLALHGSGASPTAREFQESLPHLAMYGSDAGEVLHLSRTNPAWGEPLVPGHPFTGAEVIWAVRREMARSVEDVLARRVRLLILDARAAASAAPKVALLMAEELGRDEAWTRNQVAEFNILVRQYLP